MQSISATTYMQIVEQSCSAWKQLFAFIQKENEALRSEVHALKSMQAEHAQSFKLIHHKFEHFESRHPRLVHDDNNNNIHENCSKEVKQNEDDDCVTLMDTEPDDDDDNDCNMRPTSVHVTHQHEANQQNELDHSSTDTSPIKLPLLEVGTLGFECNDAHETLPDTIVEHASTSHNHDNHLHPSSHAEEANAHFMLGFGVNTEPDESQAMFGLNHDDDIAPAMYDGDGDGSKQRHDQIMLTGGLHSQYQERGHHRGSVCLAVADAEEEDLLAMEKNSNHNHNHNRQPKCKVSETIAVSDRESGEQLQAANNELHSVLPSKNVSVHVHSSSTVAANPAGDHSQVTELISDADEITSSVSSVPGHGRATQQCGRKRKSIDDTSNVPGHGGGDGGKENVNPGSDFDRGMQSSPPPKRMRIMRSNKKKYSDTLDATATIPETQFDTLHMSQQHRLGAQAGAGGNDKQEEDDDDDSETQMNEQSDDQNADAKKSSPSPVPSQSNSLKNDKIIIKVNSDPIKAFQTLQRKYVELKRDSAQLKTSKIWHDPTHEECQTFHVRYTQYLRKLQKAIEKFEKIDVDRQTVARAYFLAANSMCNFERSKPAEEIYEMVEKNARKGLEFDVRSYEGYLCLAYIMEEKGALSEAIAMYQQCIEFAQDEKKRCSFEKHVQRIQELMKLRKT